MKLKVRIRHSSVVKGTWWACYVTDCEPTPDGFRQKPVILLQGARGRTPKEAYLNLMKGPKR